jgi:ADP-ribosylglycohydrolase
MAYGSLFYHYKRDKTLKNKLTNLFRFNRKEVEMEIITDSFINAAITCTGAGLSLTPAFPAAIAMVLSGGFGFAKNVVEAVVLTTKHHLKNS